MVYAKLLNKRKEIDDYFSNSKNLHEKSMSQFFNKEINDQDLKMTQTDFPVMGDSKKKRVCLCPLEVT